MTHTIQIARLLFVASLMAVLAFVSLRAASGRIQKGQATKNIPPDTVITLERTVCYGMCPNYKLTISADGAVVFEGRRFVKKVGTAQSTISQDQLRELIDRFERINYFHLRDRYEDNGDGCEGVVTDHPSAITSIRTNGKTKSVRHYYGCRGVAVLEDLTKLEQAIDDAVNSTQWIR